MIVLEWKYSDNLIYLIQTFLDLFACGFLILYFTFERSVDTGGRSELENLGFIVLAIVLHVLFIITGFVINIKHESSMTTFSVYYLNIHCRKYSFVREFAPCNSISCCTLGHYTRF